MDRKEHAFRRRVNVKALNPTTIKSMEERILKNIRYFCTQLVDEKPMEWSKPRDMTTMVGYLISDVMGDVTFGRNWEVMRKPDNRDLMTQLPQAVGGIHLTGYVREWFPPGTDMGVPHYALHHHEAYFAKPFEFKSERWPSTDLKSLDTTGSTSVESEQGLVASAFTPFGFGRTSCIGKYLPYQEMSLTLARMIWLYEMRIQPGSTLGEGNGKLGLGRQRKNEFQTLDRFVSMHDGPMVEFKRRT